MYDPHHLRRNDRRYYTRKGQIIQAKAVNPPFTIEPNKVETYRQYILRNKLNTPPPPRFPIVLEDLKIEQGSYTGYIQFNEFDSSTTQQNYTMPAGNKLCFLVNEKNGNQNWQIFYTTVTSYPVEANSWFYAVNLTNSENIRVNFMSDGAVIFNVELVLTSNFLTRADVELPYDKFTVPLPEPSG